MHQQDRQHYMAFHSLVTKRGHFGDKYSSGLSLSGEAFSGHFGYKQTCFKLLRNTLG